MGVPFLTDLNLIMLLQRTSWLEMPMRFFTFLGSENFFMFVLPVVYWCIDAGLGLRIGFVLLFSNVLNGMLKLALHGPRPYWVSAQVKALAAESSFGAPSGHAQNAMGIWGITASRFGRRVAWLLAGVLIFLIGLSRLFLGVHFLLDVLLGWLLGGLICWAFLALWIRAAAWVKQRTLVEQLVLGLAAPAFLLLCTAVLTQSLRGYVLPAHWLANASRAGDPLPAPLSLEGALTATGATCGLALGLIWTERRGGFQPSGPLWKRVACFLVGLWGVAILYFGLQTVLPAGETIAGAASRFLRYAVVGLWISGGAPFAFSRLSLLEPHIRPVQEA